MQWPRNADAVVFDKRQELLAGLLLFHASRTVAPSYAIPTSGGHAPDAEAWRIVLRGARLVNIRLPTPFSARPRFPRPRFPGPFDPLKCSHAMQPATETQLSQPRMRIQCGRPPSC